MASLSVLLIGLGLAGCASTQKIRPGQALGKTQLKSAARKAELGHAKVVLRNGQEIRDAKIRLTPNSLSFLDRTGRADSTLPLGEVHSLSFVSRGHGALQGLFIGGLFGAGLGITIGLASGDDRHEPAGFGGDPEGTRGLTAENEAAMLGILMGLLFGISGAAVGGATGAEVIYLFAPPEAR